VEPAEWLVGRVPTALVPGHEAEFELTVKGQTDGHTLAVDLLWMKEEGFGGGLGMAGRKKLKGPGPYTFNITPEDRDGLHSYLLNIYVSPTGNWADKTAHKTIPVPKEGAMVGATFDPQVADQNFIIETVFRTESGGTLLSKMDADAGHAVRIEDGEVVLDLKSGGNATAHTAAVDLADGDWHHLLVEVDRKASSATVYVDGEERHSQDVDLDGRSLVNTSDMFIGKGPDGDFFEGAIDFLRISRGTLADAQTTIEELYEWQFNGPQHRDFTGRAPTGAGRDAGAIELVD
jgi:hypothetical protein